MKNKKTSNLIFVSAILFTTIVVLVFACFNKKEINSYENRYADKIPKFTFSNFVNGDFQNGVESGLSDQLPASERIKKLYNDLSSAYLNFVLKFTHKNDSKALKENSGYDNIKINPVPNYNDNRYYLIGENIYNFNGQLLIKPSELPKNMDNTGLVPYIKKLAARSDFETFVYFIERETDIDFATGEKPGIYPALKTSLNLDDGHIACFAINTFEEYNSFFYKTDHHWDADGSYKGYTEIAKLLGLNNILKPYAKLALGSGKGSRAIYNAQGYSEVFEAYNFDFPEFDIYINGEEAKEYGELKDLYESAENGQNFETLSYGQIYGRDNGETVFVNKNSTGNGCILVFGDSFDNAILKLLASHFDVLYSIDIRNYEAAFNKSFDIDAYLKNKNIDKVIFIGQLTNIEANGL